MNGFLCDKATVPSEAIKETRCIISSEIQGMTNGDCKLYKTHAISMYILFMIIQIITYFSQLSLELWPCRIVPELNRIKLFSAK
jgi:hypothetical protein